MRKLYFLFALLILMLVQANAQDIKTYQAEDAYFYHAKVETEHAGFTGTGYVNFDNESGSYIEWTVFMESSDSQTVFIRYANGSTSIRTMDLHVDSSIISIDFQPSGVWTNWRTDSVNVNLNSGTNKLKLTSATSDGGPNIDKIDVTGNPGVVYYELSLGVIGKGKVESSPSKNLFEEGEDVELLAIPDSGWQFLEWRGDTSGTDNPINIVMDSEKSFTAVFIAEFDTSFEFENSPIGFASLDTLGQNGTIGGKGGDTTFVTTGEELFQILDSRRDPHFDKNLPARVLIIEGKLTWNSKEMMDVKETYDLSIIGKGDNAQIEGFGLNVFRSHNIIIRNIEFRDAPDDAVNVTNELSHHIWIDHCTFSDDPAIDPGGSNHDGLLDIKDGASYVTVSWNHFRNHHKTCLLGHSDNNGATDIGRLKTTYHHNWFDNTNSRHPRIRFGEVHVFNNFYDNSAGGMSYGIASTMEADVVVEANYFEQVPHPTYVGYGDSDPGDLVEINNIFENCGEPEIHGTAFNPSKYYFYEPDDPSLLPSMLIKFCGAGKIEMNDTRVKLQADDTKPDKMNLISNYPNPFNPSTIICYQVKEPNFVNLKIFDMLGREIKQLIHEEKSPGHYTIKFESENLPSGIYLCQLTVGSTISTLKILLLR